MVGISFDVLRLRMIASGSPSIRRITCTSTPCYVSKHACVYVNQVSFLLRKSDDRATLFNDVSIISVKGLVTSSVLYNAFPPIPRTMTTEIYCLKSRWAIIDTYPSLPLIVHGA